jgi:hypothetical protein
MHGATSNVHACPWSNGLQCGCDSFFRIAVPIFKEAAIV